jgi:hypothetical protein
MFGVVELSYIFSSADTHLSMEIMIKKSFRL